MVRCSFNRRILGTYTAFVVCGNHDSFSEGDGPQPEIGELIAIRFAAFCGSNKIDDIFDTPEPYYTRVGSGGLIKGVESEKRGLNVFG